LIHIALYQAGLTTNDIDGGAKAFPGSTNCVVITDKPAMAKSFRSCLSNLLSIATFEWSVADRTWARVHLLASAFL
jgi:hypothetical protein